MSFRVVNEVLERSRVDNSTDLAVLVAIAEIAHHDGVGWLPQGPREDPKSIAHRSRNPLRTVERSIADLEWNLELEIRKVQRGRKRLNVYRIIAGQVLYVPPDYGRLPFTLDAPFASPEQILELRTARQLGGWSRRPGPAMVAAGHASDDPPKTGSRPANGGGSEERSLEPVQDLFSGYKPSGEEVAADAAAGRHARIKELVRAFAGVFGRWPDGRDEWGTWCAAFAPLDDQGVTPEQLALRANAYRRHFAPAWEGRPEIELSPFGLTKHWQLISASLEQSYFGLYRWATEYAWRLDEDEARWVIASSTNISDDERRRVTAAVDESRRARSDQASATLQWVERKGWALDDDAYSRELADRLRHVPATSAPDVRRKAHDRRAELRTAIANLEQGRDIA